MVCSKYNRMKDSMNEEGHREWKYNEASMELFAASRNPKETMLVGITLPGKGIEEIRGL